MKHGSLFSGIGGFDLAAEWMGWENVFHCEWNDFGKRVLNYYWPNAISYDDITKTDFTIHRGAIDILTGGFPCQPYSVAGKRKGKEDERHLWPEMLRAIREIQPVYVVGENVAGLISWDGGLVFHEVQTDLENEGYEVWPFILPAASVNAPHRRDRVWFIAYANGTKQGNNNRANTETARTLWRETSSDVPTKLCSVGITSDTNNTGTGEQLRTNRNGEAQNEGREKQPQPKLRACDRDAADTNCKRCKAGDKLHKPSNPVEFARNDTKEFITNTESTREPRECKYKSGQIQLNGRNSQTLPTGFEKFPTQPPICSRDDGFSERLDGITFPKWRSESVKAYGNAIVPQVALQIFKAIQTLNN
jgi:DNA (cytosine-5)-methyltransferase 1